MSFYLASAHLSVYHHSQRPPFITKQHGFPSPMYGARSVVSALRLTTHGISLAKPELSFPAGQ